MTLLFGSIGAGLSGLLGGCTVGPDFETSPTPAPSAYTAAGQPAETVASDGAGGASQRFMTDQPPPQWWTLFRSETLDRLVDMALAQSPTLDQATARLTQAREAYIAQAGASRYPAVDAALSAKRQKVNPEAMGFSSVSAPPPFSLFNASVSVAYVFDVFGKNRRTLEALGAVVEARVFEREAARRALAANVVSAVIRRASLSARLGCVSNLLAVQEQQLAVMEAQYKAGGLASLELENQRVLLAQTRASLPTLDHQAALVDHQLAVYLGQTPAAAEGADVKLADLYLPEELPLTLPAELARQRPDIRAAEALWHRACAQVGAAQADLYPGVTLSGSIGSQHTSADDMLNSLNVWNMGANLMQPVFRGGELKARKREAVAAYDEAAAVYRQTVLNGFQDVADALHALDSDARLLKDRTDAVRHARAACDMARQRFKAGAVSHLVVLDAQRQLLQTELDRVEAQAARYADSAALMYALGGSWQVPVPIESGESRR